MAEIARNMIMRLSSLSVPRSRVSMNVRPSMRGTGGQRRFLLGSPRDSASRLFPRARPLTAFEQSANLPRMNDMAEISDEQLMLAYGAGDVAAFERLYQRHRGKLYRFLARQLRGNGALTDEMFQDVWQRVIAAREHWKPEALFATWLYRIAHNRLADHWRALQHRPAAPGDADERLERLPDHDTPERQLTEFEERRRLQLALDELPEDQRIVVLLRLEQELTLEEIGEVTGVGRETVKSRLRYAMDKLRTRLNA
jgi:RNA polymerase sigma factor (sigma-70 family)